MCQNGVMKSAPETLMDLPDEPRPRPFDHCGGARDSYSGHCIGSGHHGTRRSSHRGRSGRGWIPEGDEGGHDVMNT